MEAMNDGNVGKKRSRDDSDLNSPEVSEAVNSDDSDLVLPEQPTKKARNDSGPNPTGSDGVDSDESVPSSPQIEHFPEDILDILDEPDTVADQNTAIEELDLVMKSFEEEILHSSPSQQVPEAPIGSSDSGESLTDLEYLLEASDDELGLPPTGSPSSENPGTVDGSETYAPETVGFGEILGFGDEFPSYDSFDFDEEPTQYENSDLVVGGLFDNDQTDFSEFLYRPESLQAQ